MTFRYCQTDDRTQASITACKCIARLIGMTLNSPQYHSWSRPHDPHPAERQPDRPDQYRSEEHTSELQSLMRISYAVFCLKKKHIQKKLEKISKKHRRKPTKN